MPFAENHRTSTDRASERPYLACFARFYDRFLMRGSEGGGLFLLSAVFACSSGSSAGAPGDPPVDPSKELAALSTSDLQSLCDWVARQEGGYGTTTHCEATGIPLYASKDQAECLAEVAQHLSRPTCTTTVGQYTMCFRVFLASWCSSMPPTRPTVCDDFQTQCYGPPPDAGVD
jgi:hypothetical protein